MSTPVQFLEIEWVVPPPRHPYTWVSEGDWESVYVKIGDSELLKDMRNTNKNCHPHVIKEEDS